MTDPVAVAILNAAVLTIYETVLAIYLRQGSNALTSLLEAAEKVRQQLHVPDLETGQILSDQPLGDYLTKGGWGGWAPHVKKLSQLRIEARRHPPTEAEGERFVYTVAALVSQYPYPTTIKPDSRGRIGSASPTFPDLSNPETIGKWVHEIRGIGVHSGLLTELSRSPIEALVNAAQARQPGARDTVDQATGYMNLAADLAEGLGSQLQYWRSTRPTITARIIMGMGFVIGAAMFGLGVIVPLIFQASAPYWLYAYVPAVWYAIVLVATSVAAIRWARLA